MGKKTGKACTICLGFTFPISFLAGLALIVGGIALYFEIPSAIAGQVEKVSQRNCFLQRRYDVLLVICFLQWWNGKLAAKFQSILCNVGPIVCLWQFEVDKWCLCRYSNILH